MNTAPTAEQPKPRAYFTTAISYPNGPPHIGHAYEAIATDFLARFYRLDGWDVHFLTGTDEHGLKMEQAGRREGIGAAAIADRMAPLFRTMADRLDVRYDDFIRTTEARHYEACAAIWRAMQASGDIYLDRYEGWYSVRDEAFFDEKELVKAADGTFTTPGGAAVEWTVEESYFFRLSAYQDRLLAHYEANPDFIGPDARRNEVMSFVKSGLRDLSISRTSFSWGVPVPDAPGHVMYVWVDALTNYLTGAGYPHLDTAEKGAFWPASLHVIGKDIVRFHAVYWPAFLLSAGLPLPQRVFAHGFLFNRGEKMSKSVGNVIDPLMLAERYGVDALRYFLLREIPFGQDGSYSHAAIVTRANADLANDLGNLAQRSLSMINKNCDGQVPEPGPFTAEDQALLAMAEGLLASVRPLMARQNISGALEEIWRVVGLANSYIATQQPWSLKKTDPARMATVLYVAAEVIRILAILAQPVTPTGAAALLDQLAATADMRDFAAVEKGRLVPGTTLPPPAGVFARLEMPVEEEAC